MSRHDFEGEVLKLLGLEGPPHLQKLVLTLDASHAPTIDAKHMAVVDGREKVWDARYEWNGKGFVGVAGGGS